MGGTILVAKAGSSSITFSAYRPGKEDSLSLHLKGQIEDIGSAPHMTDHNANGRTIAERRWPGDGPLAHEAMFEASTEWAKEHVDEVRVAAGRRIVYGGPRFARPVRIDQKVLDELRPFSPLRQLHNLAAVRTTAAIAPSLPQVACFDTAYRPSQTEAARSLALPRETHDVCVRRFEFHELSHEYTAAALWGRAAWRRRRGV